MLPRDRLRRLRAVQKVQAQHQARNRARPKSPRPYRELFDLVPLTYAQCLKVEGWERLGFATDDAVMLALQLTDMKPVQD
jgi:hypothetical protein